MSNNGKVAAKQRARELRAQAWTLEEIASEVGSAKSSVSRWVRDVEFTPRPRNRGHSSQAAHPLRQRVEAETARFAAEGRDRLAVLDDVAFLAAGTALYVGEGFKTGSQVGMANTDPEVIRFFLAWLRTQFDIDETKLRGRLYLHDDLSLDRAYDHWEAVSAIPRSQFNAPYRATAGPRRRKRRHEFGCFTALYCSATLQRKVLGLCAGLLSSDVSFGGSSAGRASHC